jgi:hypothetical protein
MVRAEPKTQKHTKPDEEVLVVSRVDLRRLLIRVEKLLELAEDAGTARASEEGQKA